MKAVTKGNVNPTSITNYSRNFPAFLFLFRLIDADPVDGHGLREDGGLIWTAGPFASDGFDDELPIFDVGVFFVVAAALPLLVEASGEFDLAVPVGGVEVGGVEFVGPDEFPVFGGSGHRRSIRS